MRRCRSILVFGVVCGCGGMQGISGDPVTGLASKIYSETVHKAADGRFTRVEIFYLDVKIMTRVAVTPQTLAKLGCHLEIRSDSPKWADLVAILQTEDVGEADRSSGEVRWGMMFYANAAEPVNELYFGPYYGPQSDETKVFGYVDKLAVSFSASLPKRMAVYIRDTNCH
jgi:hypothetical protein